MLVAYRMNGIELNDCWSLKLDDGPVLRWLYANTSIFETVGETFKIRRRLMQSMLEEIKLTKLEAHKIQCDIEYALLNEEDEITYFFKVV